MTENEAWSNAFARQAASDLTVSEWLSSTNLPANHYLEHLQKFMEKAAKAHQYSIADKAGLPKDIQESHNFITAVIPQIYREFIGRKRRVHSSEIKAVRNICRQLDLLNPAVDDGGRRKDNCEYPWQTMETNMIVPAEFKFPVLNSLQTVEGRRLIVVVKTLLQQSLV